jgi:hypothetical protein
MFDRHQNHAPQRRLDMNAAAVILKPIDHGWAVALTDGRELVRFRGLCAKRRALRYLADRGLLRKLRHVS